MSLPILIINCTVPTLFFLNNSIVGECSAEKPSLSLPISEGNFYLGIVPMQEGYHSIWTNVCVSKGEIRLLREGLRLCRWHNNIFELTVCLVPTLSNIPPVVLADAQWGDCTAGLCGEFLLLERHNGKVEYLFLGRGAAGAEIVPLNREYLLVTGMFEQQKKLFVINKQLELMLERDIHTWSFENRTLRFSEDMGIITGYKLVESYNCTESFEMIDSILEYAQDSPVRDTPLNAARCLCEAVRLGLEEQAMACITPSLREKSSFEDLSGFLGSFIELSHVKYLPNPQKDSLALLYLTNEGTYEYVCYAFEAVKISGEYLIDDIEEL